MKRVPLLLLSLLLCFACSHKAELKQEIAVSNDMLPAPLCMGMTAESISLEGNEVVYHVTVDEESYYDMDFNDPQHRESLKVLMTTLWMTRPDKELLGRLEQADCSVAYHFTMDPGGDTCTVHFSLEELREAVEDQTYDF